MSYREDPFNRIVACHFEDGEPPPPPPIYDDPCGMFYYPSVVPFVDTLVWAIGTYQPVLLGLAHTLSANTENPDWNQWIPVGPNSMPAYSGLDKYYWGNYQAGVHIRADATGWGYDKTEDPGPPPSVGVDLWYHTLGQDFVLDHAVQPPDEHIAGGTIFDYEFPPSRGWPIFVFWFEFPGGTPFYMSYVDPLYCSLRIQMRCLKQFNGIPPPQPSLAEGGNPPGGLWHPYTKYYPSPPDPPQIRVPPRPGYHPPEQRDTLIDPSRAPRRMK